ncbi:HVO_2901 family zinc finger protein [Haloferacaceae archaeon DSL9]
MQLLRTQGRDMLMCRKCGSTFPEGRATQDGWHYRCPTEDCGAEGIGDGLRRLRD